jgi:ABC-type multidrug transport system fused ATPase/permease subunit
MKGNVESKILLVTLQIMSDLVAWFSISIRLYAELENCMTCSQRMLDYTTLEIEDDLTKPVDIALKKDNWPSQGVIEYSNVTMTYREELPPAIKNLSFKAEAGMKVGIVGRTGSGKSSILQTLFRLVDVTEGNITIDGVDVKEPGLH